MQTITGKLDEAKKEAFGQKMLETMNGAALSLMISLGHRTGLLDTMASMPPSTSAQIAERSKLNERYVREWLSALTVGRVLDYDAESKTFYLPPEHAAFLTRAASPQNMASATQWVAVLGQVEDHVLDCFRNGGGVHYCKFSRFHDVMAEESAQSVIGGLEEHILPMLPNGKASLEFGIDVLDIGCGVGRAMIALAAAFPNSRFQGFDFSDEAVGKANAEVDRRGLKNVRFEKRDAANLGLDSACDLITAFDAIHDQAEPARVLKEIRKALKPDGVFLMQDIASSSHVHKNMDHPIAPFLYTISCMHCMTVSLAMDGAGLGTCWGEELAVNMLNEAGFPNVDIRKLPHDFMNNYYIAKA